ncbi:hypothetical protein MWU60_00980 [Yoonia sp. F2084L]|uniref:hypothetical protein n=1 Tax=Yoonia sp. F2084L TaxID=2926419 RepID=UPI001FF537F0|nr:hypothetical protein [Yoonia sp. F2084L]MCK0094128.1 hypothetical protein [Yoonia sp. F2084L]
MERTDHKRVWCARLFSRPFLASLAAAGLISGPVLGQGAESSASPDSKFVTLLGIHSATVAPSGILFGGVSQSFNLEGDDSEEDVAASLGFGLGDANNGFGLQFTATANSETDTFDSFSYFGLKTATRLQSAAAPTYIGFAIDRIAGSGAAEDVDEAASVMLTRFSSMQAGNSSYPTIATVGAGTHVSDLATEPGVFFGAGIGLSRNLGMSAAWNGEWIELGTGFKIGAIENLTVTLAVADALNETDRQQISLGLSWFIDAGQWR